MMKNVYPILCLLFIGASSCAMEKRKEPECARACEVSKKVRLQPALAEKSAFEKLPADVQGIFLNLLVTAPGQTDAQMLDIAAQNIRNFMTLNKSFLKYLTDERINGYLIQQLAQRYTHGNLIKAAAALHTAAGGAWLSRNIALEDEQNLRATFIQAAGAGDLRLVSFVLKYIPTVFYNNAKVNGDTALIAAVKNRHDAVVNRLLMVPNIDVNATDRIRSTALMCALDDLAYGPANNDVVMRLLAVPAIEVNVQDDVGATALMFAASNGNTHAVEWLLARNDIDVNLFNQFGNTALSLAVGDGHPEAAKRLLAAPGIDVISEDDEGMTALTLAQEHLQEPQRSTVIALIQARQIEQEKEEAEELSYEQGGV